MATPRRSSDEKTLGGVARRSDCLEAQAGAMVSVVGGLLSQSALRAVGGEERPQGHVSLLGKGQVGAHANWMQARLSKGVAAHWSKSEPAPTLVMDGPGQSRLSDSHAHDPVGSSDLTGHRASAPLLGTWACVGTLLEPHRRTRNVLTIDRSASPSCLSRVPTSTSAPCSSTPGALTTSAPTSTSPSTTAALPATRMCSSRLVHKAHGAASSQGGNDPAPEASGCAHVTGPTSPARAAARVPGITNASAPGGCVTAGSRGSRSRRRRPSKPKGAKSTGRCRYGAKGRSESGPVHRHPAGAEAAFNVAPVTGEVGAGSRSLGFTGGAAATGHVFLLTPGTCPETVMTSDTGTAVKRNCARKIVQTHTRHESDEMGNINYPLGQARSERPVTPLSGKTARGCLTSVAQACENEQQILSVHSDGVPIPTDRVTCGEDVAGAARGASAGGHVLGLTGRAGQASDGAPVAASGSWTAGLPLRRALSPQCPAPPRASHPRHDSVWTAASCHVPVMNAHAHEHSRVTAPDTPPDGHPPPPEPPPRVTTTGSSGEDGKAAPPEAEDAAKGHSLFALRTTCGRGQWAAGLREDIRAFDIYKISGGACASHVPPLPALPTQSDTDTDTDEGSLGRAPRALRKRKINAEVRDGVERKRYRESEDEEEEEDRLRLEGVTLLLPTPVQLHSDFNKPRLGADASVARTLSCPLLTQESCPYPTASPSAPTTAPPTASHPETSACDAEMCREDPAAPAALNAASATTPSDSVASAPATPPSPTSPCSIAAATAGSASSTSRACCGAPLLAASPGALSSGCDDADDTSSEDTLSDDDDDGASTVVPEDFWDETDSDIEVLVQSESWVDLSNQPSSPDRVTPLPFGNGEEYLRLLREAQKDSNQSSARVSLASSRRDTPRDSPHDSPKSPPNSPNTEMATDPEEAAVLKGVYINYYNKEGDFIRVEKNTETDWIWDWSSRPDQTPPKEWRFSHPRKGVSRGASIRRVMVGNSSLFSRDVLYTLLITNVLSLILGTGIGIWLSKRSGSNVISTLPIN
ncbi:mucin-5AC-like isoform X2 [Penaeus indicus]|uniref:mucin-5AC-like isoform X2 n=1 Tax=Penaeus indicus TaxID=29960 RepID=UPI00300CD596